MQSDKLARPTRKTRNKRLQITESDNEFYENEFWAEEDNDSDWSIHENPENSDEYESECFLSTSESEDDNFGLKLDKELWRKECQSKKRKQSYEKVIQNRLKRSDIKKRVWSVIESPIKINKKVTATQEYMLSCAKALEVKNKAYLNEYENNKSLSYNKKVQTPRQSNMLNIVSTWTSHPMVDSTGTYESQLLIYYNTSKNNKNLN